MTVIQMLPASTHLDPTIVSASKGLLEMGQTVKVK